ncbi:AMP-binding protein [Kytococcus sp. Marseille-QA3725]
MTDEHQRLAVAYGPEANMPTLHDAVERVVKQWPEQVALSTEEASYTYAELWRSAQNWSGLLAEHGVVEGDIVVVTGKRSTALVAALLGVLIRGAVYSIVDPGWPMARRKVLIERLHPRLGIGHDPGEIDLDGLPLDDLNHVPDFAPAPGQVTPDDPACVFWTSGSTGMPKAVVATHRANSRLFGSSSPVPVGPGHALPALAAVAWDGFALELWSQLLAGGRLILHSADYFMPGDARAAVNAGATDIFLTAGLFDIFVVEDLECFAGFESVWVGGDKLSPYNSARFLERYPDVPLINIYGPAECGIFIASHRVSIKDTVGDGIPVGSPTPEAVVTVVDDGRIVSGDAFGEIWTAGPPLALGYLGDDAASSAAFVDAPMGAPVGVPGDRWYRTGDLGRLDANAVLHFHGRVDRQIKVAGHRLEPAEIEAAALAEGCDHACVVPRTHDGVVVGLAMAAVSAQPINPRDLRDRLARSLLPQAVPWPILMVPDLPLNSSGKIDRLRVADLITSMGR